MTTTDVMVSVVVMVVVMVMSGVMETYAQLGKSCVDGKGEAGECVNIRSCQPLLELLSALRTNTAPPNALQTMRRSVCEIGTSGGLMVCCAQVVQPAGGSGSGRDLLPTHCGRVDLTDRIVDGEDAPLLAWPWMVLLRGKGLGQPNSSWICGGVLISDRYVLTAAHCFNNHQLEFVRIGEHTLSTNPDCHFSVCAPQPQDIPTEQIITHPQYRSPCRDCNDIALLRLARPAQVDSLYVVPICLPVDPVKDMGFPEEEFQGKHGWAAGWGSVVRNPLRPVLPDKLQQVSLPIREDTVCPVLKAGYPDPRMVLCAGGDTKDTCKGDSGGPLQLSNKKETRRFVVGITSAGPGVCGRRDSQALYTNVHYYVDWILQTLRP